MRAGNYEKSLENSPAATKEYTRGATGNNDYRGISGGIIDHAIGGIVDYTGTLSYPYRRCIVADVAS